MHTERQPAAGPPLDDRSRTPPTLPPALNSLNRRTLQETAPGTRRREAGHCPQAADEDAHSQARFLSGHASRRASRVYSCNAGPRRPVWLACIMLRLLQGEPACRAACGPPRWTHVHSEARRCHRGRSHGAWLLQQGATEAVDRLRAMACVAAPAGATADTQVHNASPWPPDFTS